MISFNAEIEYFAQMGEKTGWKYVFIPLDIAEKLKPGFRKSFRIKGMIDSVEISGAAIIPMGEGNFILPLKQSLRKALNKDVKDTVQLNIIEDTEFKVVMPEDLEACLLDEQYLMDRFLKHPKSHQNYFIKWIDEAKTIETRTKRILQTINAMEKLMDYGEMIREGRTKSKDQ